MFRRPLDGLLRLATLPNSVAPFECQLNLLQASGRLRKNMPIVAKLFSVEIFISSFGEKNRPTFCFNFCSERKKTRSGFWREAAFDCFCSHPCQMKHIAQIEVGVCGRKNMKGG